MRPVWERSLSQPERAALRATFSRWEKDSPTNLSYLDSSDHRPPLQEKRVPVNDFVGHAADLRRERLKRTCHSPLFAANGRFYRPRARKTCATGQNNRAT